MHCRMRMSPWAYEAKHAALHGAKRYDEAIDAFKSMQQVIKESRDPAIRQLCKNYLSPSETVAVIDPIIHRTLKNCPLVVLDVTTGRLCDITQRMRIFKISPTFKELVSSMMKAMDDKWILRVIASFFGYIMFSHAWQGEEPSFQDVNMVKSVWNLPETPLNRKLRSFCNETRRLGHNWAWSDTCCIDKTNPSVVHQSLTSMYKWYADSAATLVFLAGVAHPSKPGDLTRSLWMTRAWTLQELLSPRVILFYDSEWKFYLGDAGANHKESQQITQELVDTIEIVRGTIVTFSPDDLGVREKLRLASTRNATVEEDVAYSLIGVFKSDIRPNYGEGADALGHLLEEIVARFGDVTVPACFHFRLQPNSLQPYISGRGRDGNLHHEITHQEALSIYGHINFLPPARFAFRRLYLPCIVFPIRRLGIQGIRRGNEKLYHAKVSGLGRVDFTTADDLPLNEPQKFAFAHPWIRHIRGPSSGIAWGSDSESDTDHESNLDGDARSDEVTPLYAVPEPQVDSYTQALQMIARLGQPFNALLLAQQPNGEYKRVAAEDEIVVSGLGTNVTSKNIRAHVMEIL
ncbi:hypothetical protein F5J12DRAFT_784758 [Pisolithus orientalis]|uniref:uncharacterized protein n=1 Tax=Pisolithus orientalis TaxID=936130 RepID=UPI002224C35F|nr:uncharacterized protein F5J12DRAFT_784758 [Pisolithus orientalis]KAI5998905.1 hypothetical protein F5J12DRAFT_784758 [Pisolithus orientalis]